MIFEIKSRYILKYIFEYISTKNILGISKYNNKLKIALDKSLKDYKIFNQIEIEIIPNEIKNSEKNAFIKINESNKYFFHIYFNDNYTKRIKRNYITEKDGVSKINIVIDYENNRFEKLFKNCNCIKEINFFKM